MATSPAVTAEVASEMETLPTVTPPITQAEPPAAMNQEPESRTTRRKRKAAEIVDSLRECLCGQEVTTAEQAGEGEPVIKCNRKTCETIWYHMSCVLLEYRPRSWACQACARSKR
ncbi:hypothetical protein AAF712_011176 [Marasmius tenuissimus]|uniref:Zinc finger PHD-type domain-containing protein n=1 Tax=Marasmius tenuissimus TaxID=585030 RepID=A0ABR2ZJY7_9AGAR